MPPPPLALGYLSFSPCSCSSAFPHFSFKCLFMSGISSSFIKSPESVSFYPHSHFLYLSDKPFSSLPSRVAEAAGLTGCPAVAVSVSPSGSLGKLWRGRNKDRAGGQARLRLPSIVLSPRTLLSSARDCSPWGPRTSMACGAQPGKSGIRNLGQA